jgi:hypothetical protein
VRKKNKALLIFLDGVGIGEENPEQNPFFRLGFKTFTELFGAIPSLQNQRLHGKDMELFPVDATMGVDGLPQSGTGQASIFCGINAPKIIGMHFGPYPYSTLVPIIKKQNFFQYYKEQKQRAFFANAYPKLFFDYFKKNKHRLSVSTLSYTSAGHKLNSATDVRRCRALTAEMTNARWNAKLHYTIPVISPEGAAKRLLHIAAKNTFTLYEFFLTDYLGHGRIALEFEEIYHNLDRFLYTIFTEHGEDITVFLISDHGNLEDVSVKAHTTNPALGMVSGKDAAKQAKKIKSLKDIKKTITSVTG